MFQLRAVEAGILRARPSSALPYDRLQPKQQNQMCLYWIKKGEKAEGETLPSRFPSACCTIFNQIHQKEVGCEARCHLIRRQRWELASDSWEMYKSDIFVHVWGNFSASVERSKNRKADGSFRALNRSVLETGHSRTTC